MTTWPGLVAPVALAGSLVCACVAFAASGSVAAALAAVLAAVALAGLWLAGAFRAGRDDRPADHDGGGSEEKKPEDDPHDALLYAISHDLRSPLGAVLNYAAVLEEDHGRSLDEDARHLLERIRASSGRAVDRIDGLLALSRVATARYEPREIEMQAMVEDVAAQVVPGSVRLRIGPLPPATGDADLVREVWKELLEDASRYTAECEDPAIEVSGCSLGDRVEYRVRDNGEGFDMRFVSRLFRPFERLHSDERSGVGIGLARVAAIVRRHGGEVAAEGDGGAAMSFSLPLAPDPPPAAGPGPR